MMLVSLQQTLPEQWQETARVLAAGFSWILDFERLVLPFSLTGGTAAGGAAKAVVLLLPTALLVAALWCTMASLYTLPFRSGRGGFLTTLLLCWWDAGRMMWFYWAGLVRLVVVLLGWLWNLLKLAGSLLLRLVRFLFTQPLRAARPGDAAVLPAGRAVARLPVHSVLVSPRGDHLHVHAQAHDHGADGGHHRAAVVEPGGRPGAVAVPVRRHLGQLRRDPGAVGGGQVRATCPRSSGWRSPRPP